MANTAVATQPSQESMEPRRRLRRDRRAADGGRVGAICPSPPAPARGREERADPRAVPTASSSRMGINTLNRLAQMVRRAMGVRRFSIPRW
jgi:hypothetical protein